MPCSLRMIFRGREHHCLINCELWTGTSIVLMILPGFHRPKLNLLPTHRLRLVTSMSWTGENMLLMEVIPSLIVSISPRQIIQFSDTVVFQRFACCEAETVSGLRANATHMWDHVRRSTIYRAEHHSRPEVAANRAFDNHYVKS